MKTKKCAVCGVTYSPRQFMQKTCGYDCAKSHANKAQKEKTIKPTVKSRLKEFKETVDHIKRVQLILNGYIYCESCIATRCNLEGHHIVYRSEAPNHTNLHNKRNLILLCRKCHDRYHAVKGRRGNLIVLRRLWELFPEYIKEEMYNTFPCNELL